MADFDSLLKKSLAVVNDAFQEARSDVSSIVEKLSRAVKENAGDQFAVEFSEVRADVKGVTFRIYLDTDVNDMDADIVTVAHIRIPATGYPVLYGGWNKHVNTFVPEDGADLADISAVEGFFAQLLENPESTLIQALGYALRRKALKKQ